MEQKHNSHNFTHQPITFIKMCAREANGTSLICTYVHAYTSPEEAMWMVDSVSSGAGVCIQSYRSS